MPISLKRIFLTSIIVSALLVNAVNAFYWVPRLASTAHPKVLQQLVGNYYFSVLRVKLLQDEIKALNIEDPKFNDYRDKLYIDMKEVIDEKSSISQSTTPALLWFSWGKFDANLRQKLTNTLSSLQTQIDKNYEVNSILDRIYFYDVDRDLSINDLSQKKSRATQAKNGLQEIWNKIPEELKSSSAKQADINFNKVLSGLQEIISSQQDIGISDLAESYNNFQLEAFKMQSSILDNSEATILLEQISEMVSN